MASPPWPRRSSLGHLDLIAPITPKSPGSHCSQRPQSPIVTTPLPKSSLNNGHRTREGSLLDRSNNSDADAESLTSSQVDRICNIVDTGLPISSFSPGFRTAPARVRTTSSSLRVDLSQLTVVTLFLHASGSPKGLSCTSKQGHVQEVGDCQPEPGCVRTWKTPDLKYLVYRDSLSGLDTRPFSPELFRVHDVWFAAHVDDTRTALAMSGMMTFRFSSLGLVLDRRVPHFPYEQTHAFASDFWCHDTSYHDRAVAPNMPESLGYFIKQKNTGRFKIIVRRFVQGRTGQQTIAKRVGASIRRMIKRPSDQ